jgi:protein-S-isoprenylcysteine O-methyltransferase Ste14
VIGHSPFLAVTFDTPAEIACVAVTLGWVSFGVIVARGKRNQAIGHAKLDTKSRIGFFLQIVACLACIVMRRTFFSPPLPMASAAERIFAGLVVILSAASVWFCYAAATVLGKQWALDARVIAGHELVRAGPFAVVRNPIYLAMLGMTLATYFAVSRWQALPVLLILFAFGTAIRIRTEEKLLRAHFGAQFDDYARRVPAFFPGRFRTSIDR